MKLTSIVIPVWNQLDQTRECLEALCRHTKAPYELVIVDNGSTDGTAGFLSRAFSAPPLKLKIIHNPRNLGVPKAFNQGIGQSSGDYILFLNNDVIVGEGWLTQLVEAIECGDFSLAGKEIIWFDLGERFGNRKMPYIEGSCLLVKREVFDKIGGFDEEYSPAYWEDSDFCYRAFIHNFKMTEVRDLPIVHHRARTTYNQNEFDVKEVDERNKAKFYHKWAKEPFKRVLIIRLDATGDVIMASTIASGYRRAYPNWHITFYCLPQLRDLVNTPYVDRIVTSAGEMQSGQYDMAINLQDYKAGEDLARKSGAPVVLGIDEPLLGQPIEVRRRIYESGLHLVDIYGEVAQIKPGEDYLHIDDVQRVYVNDLLARLGVKEPFVALHLGGTMWEGNNWPLDKIEKLVARLRGDFDLIALGKGRYEIPKGVHNAMGLTPEFGQVGELIRRAKCLICVDSGVMHIASAVETPTITTYGPMHPNICGPKRNRYDVRHYPIVSKLPCSPCFSYKCPKGNCECRMVDVNAVMGKMRYIKRNIKGRKR